MNTVTRWDPFKEMEETQNRLVRFFGLTPARVPNGDREAMTITQWAPSVDINDVLKVHLPKSEKAKPRAVEIKVA